LGVGRKAAKRLGHRLKQNAIVWIGEKAIPELIMLMPMGRFDPGPKTLSARLEIELGSIPFS